jgi:hypothetical protein
MNLKEANSWIHGSVNWISLVLLKIGIKRCIKGFMVRLDIKGMKVRVLDLSNKDN